MADSSEIIVGYWKIRGRGAIVRSLLAYCETPFKNKLYRNIDEWFNNDKQSLGLDYPNLPYLIDGEKKIAESGAILHYIPIRAGKRELIGDTDEKFIQVQVAFSVGLDINTEICRILYGGGDFEANLEETFKKGKFKAKFDLFEKNLTGKEWLTGFLSIADFQLFEIVDMIHEMDAVKLEPYPNLLSFRNRFLEIPQIKAHRESENFIKLWFVPGKAAWPKSA